MDIFHFDILSDLSRISTQMSFDKPSEGLLHYVLEIIFNSGLFWGTLKNGITFVDLLDVGIFATILIAFGE